MSVKGDWFSSTLFESTLPSFKPSTQEGQGNCWTVGYKLGITHLHSLTTITSLSLKGLASNSPHGVCEWRGSALRRLRCHSYFIHSTHYTMKTPCSTEEGNKTKEKDFSCVTPPLQSRAEAQAQLCFCHHSPYIEF